VNEATPGGLVGIGTKLDPSMTKGDELAGQVAGIPGKLPPVLEKFDLEVRLLEKVVGTAKELEVEPIKLNEILMLSSGTATTIATVTSMKKDRISVNLRRPICASPGSRVAISRRFGARWHLIGFGTLG
jgi:translation initiation factor 2 subunit 3